MVLFHPADGARSWGALMAIDGEGGDSTQAAPLQSGTVTMEALHEAMEKLALRIERRLAPIEADIRDIKLDLSLIDHRFDQVESGLAKLEARLERVSVDAAIGREASKREYGADPYRRERSEIGRPSGRAGFSGKSVHSTFPRRPSWS
jgi:hypothetical protein